MTSIRHFAQAFFAVALALTLATCTLPVGAVKSAEPAKSTTLLAGQARLVFQVGQAKSARALTDAGYMTLEMRSVADGTVKADDASREADGSYLIDIDGLVAGDWRLKVRLYGDINSTDLLYYADLTQYVAVGTPTSVALKVYEPSSLAGGTIGLADKVEYLEVEGRGLVWGTSLNPLLTKPLQTFRPGESVQIHAIPMTVPYDEDVAVGFDSDSIKNPIFDEYWDPTFDPDDLDNPLFDDEDYYPAWDDNTDQGLLARPATDDRVTYLSDDPDVVDISTTGRMKARGIGETIIHITTVEGRKTASIPVRVEEPIAGVWEFGSPVDRVLKIERTATGLQAHLLSELSTGATAPEHKLGRVTRQLDGSYKVAFDQRLGFRMVNAIEDRTQRIFLYDYMPTNATLSELASGDLSVVIANMMSSFTYTRVGDYVPVNTLNRTDADPLVEPTTNDGWALAGGRWNIENNTAGQPETLSHLYWWVEDPNVASVDARTGVVTLHNSGNTMLRATSLDNPGLAPLSWPLEVQNWAPSLALSNLAIDIPEGYVSGVPAEELGSVNLRIQVAFDPAEYEVVVIERWNGSGWVAINGGTSLTGLNASDWFDNLIPVDPATVVKFRVITKGSTTTGYLHDSVPSPEIVAMAPDAFGNPVLWPGANLIPGSYGTSDVVNGVEVPYHYFDGNDYWAQWFVTYDVGATWVPSTTENYSLRWGTQTWRIYSDSTGPGTVVVGRDISGAIVGSPIILSGLSKFNNISSVMSNGRVNLWGVGGGTATLAWNSTSMAFEEYNP